MRDLWNCFFEETHSYLRRLHKTWLFKQALKNWFKHRENEKLEQAQLFSFRVPEKNPEIPLQLRIESIEFFNIVFWGFLQVSWESTNSVKQANSNGMK